MSRIFHGKRWQSQLFVPVWQESSLMPRMFEENNCFRSWSCTVVRCLCLCNTLISWMASAIAIKGTLANTLMFAARWFQVGRIEIWFVHFARGQQKFCGFNFSKWLFIREKCENKSLAKITNHTVFFRVQSTNTCKTALFKRKGKQFLTHSN